MAIILSVLSGVIIFVIGQFTLKVIIEPIQKQRETIADILFSLTCDYTLIHNAEVTEKEKSDVVYYNLKKLGARLLSNQQLIPFDVYLNKISSLPEPSKIRTASTMLAQMSNFIYGDGTDGIKYLQLDLFHIQIFKLLNLNGFVNIESSEEELRKQINELKTIRTKSRK